MTNDIPLPDMPDSDQPCGCGQASGVSPLENEGNLPDPLALEQELDLLINQVGSEADELLFADLDTDESQFQEELQLAGLSGEPLPPMEDILAIAERYPGLKITFSF